MTRLAQWLMVPFGPEENIITAINRDNVIHHHGGRIYPFSRHRTHNGFLLRYMARYLSHCLEYPRARRCPRLASSARHAARLCSSHLPDLTRLLQPGSVHRLNGCHGISTPPHHGKPSRVRLSSWVRVFLRYPRQSGDFHTGER